MTVEEKTFQMSLGVTMDQSIPAEVLPNDRLAVVLNARVRKPGGLYKRYGYTSHVRTRLDTGSNIGAGKRFIRREKELAITDGERIHAYAPTLQKWVQPDRVPSCQVLSHETVIEDEQGLGFHDASIAVAGNYACVIARSVSGSPNFDLHSRVINLTTGVVINSTVLDAATIGGAKVLACGSTFVVVYRENGANDIKARAFQTLTASPAWTAETTLRNDNNVSGLFDVCVTGNNFVLAHYTSGNQLDAYIYDTAFAQLAVTTNLRAAKTVTQLSVHVTSAVLFLALFNSTDGAVEVMGRDPTNLGLIFAVQTLEAASAGADGLTVGTKSLSAWVAWMVLGSTATPYANQFGLRYRGVGVGGAVDATTYTTWNVAPASRIWNYNSHSYIMGYTARGAAAANQINQKALIVLDMGNDEIIVGSSTTYRMRPVGRWGEGETYEGVVGLFPPAVVAGPTTGTFLCAYTMFGDTSVRGDRVEMTTLNFDDTAAVRWVGQSQIGKDTFIPGGLPYVYDGQRCFEAGFTYDPIIPEVLAIAGGSLAADTYTYVACFVYSDASGRVWRSAPSQPFSITLSGGNGTARVRVNHYSVTAMTDSELAFAYPPGVEVYRRSITNPAFTRLRHPTIGSIWPSDPQASTYLQIDDGTGGITTNDEPELYTEGGVLENFCPPACRYSVIFDNRLWLGACADPEVLQFSREIVDREGAFFHPDLNIRIDDGQGVQAMAVMDASLIVLKKDNEGLFYIQGTGPDDLGDSNAYNQPQKIMSSIGCSEPRSVFVGDPGCFFQSRRGLELLTRGPGRVEFFGAPVEDAVDSADTITSVAYEPASGEYRFTLPTGNAALAAVFTEPTKTWAVDSCIGGQSGDDQYPIDGCTIDGTYHWLTKNGFVYFENGQFFDSKASVLSWITSGFTTGDIALAGPLGQPRHFRVVLLGTKRGDHGLSFTLTLDQNQTAAGTKTFTAIEVNAFKWLPLEVPSVNTTEQDGRSIRVTVVDLTDGGETPTEGAIWYHMLIDWGGEKRPTLVPPVNRK